MVISIYNHKGGTGKTSTTVNLGKALANLDYEVLLIDIDPQANLTFSLGIELEDKDKRRDQINILISDEGFDILPNSREPTFRQSALFSSDFELEDIIEELNSQYDFILIDNPPSQSIDVEKALLVSDYVLIPTLLDALSMEGVRQVIQGLRALKERENSKVKLLGILPSMVDLRRNLSRNILARFKEKHKVYVFESFIRTDVRMAEAPLHNSSVISYKPKSRGAKEFKALAKELISLVGLRSI